jgi:hypothetical protein
MVEHTTEKVADTLSAADILAVVDMKAVMGKQSLDTVTALCLVLHIDYMDQIVRIPSVRQLRVGYHTHYRNVYWDHFSYHNLYRKQGSLYSVDLLQHAYHVHIVYRTRYFLRPEHDRLGTYSSLELEREWVE